MCIVLREVATLSRLQHQHVVRYYQTLQCAGALCTGSSLLLAAILSLVVVVELIPRSHEFCIHKFQAWFETEVGGYAETTWGSLTVGSSSCSYKGDTTVNLTGPDNKLESTYLYIQMEYCPR
ncbi:hypothetical protein ACLOJK_008998 [Asimina triloba]